MIQKIKKITAFLLSIAVLAGVLATTMTAFAAKEDAELKKGEFIFAPHTYPDGDLSDIYYYTDAVFSGSAFDYNEHLATMSMIMAAASISSQDADADYDVKSRNLGYLFREWDFTGFSVNDYYTQRPDEQTMGVGIAYKVIGQGDDAYTLLAIVPRSAGYQREWAGNFTVGKEGVHEGFATGRDIILEFAQQYVEENGENFKGTVKVWTVGYSRGAGVANLLAAYLDDNSNALGIEIGKENIFAYTFGTPSNVQYADEAEKALLESNYRNIHNRYSDYDIVTYAPFKDWNFTCYGTTKLFDVQNEEKKAQMLTFLEKSNQMIYELYTAENSSADPDNFMPLMLQVDLSEGLGVSLVPANPEYGIPTTQQEFLDERIGFLVENLVPDRDTYVDGGYQYALQRLTSLYFGLDAEQGSLLFEGMSHDVKTLAAAYYCYYIADCCLDDAEQRDAAVVALAESLPLLEMYIELGAEDEEVFSSEWYIYASEFIASEEYAQLKALLASVAADPELFAESFANIHDALEEFAVGTTAKVLGSGVAALTIDEEEKAALMETMTSAEVAEPLTKFFIYLLLGSEEGVVTPFDPCNKNISLAVTFLANAGRYMRVHNNEIILSWLRTEDSYYENEDWHIHENTIKFDANAHWEECECGYKSESRVHAFGEWSALPVTQGTESLYVCSCPCGCEETKPAEDVNNMAGMIDNTTGALPVVLISGGAIIMIAAIAAMVVVSKKRKTNSK